MELTIIKLSLERLLEKMEEMAVENADLKGRVLELEKNQGAKNHDCIEPVKEDVLLDTKEVLRILGICDNTLRAIINKNLIAPIRINQRRIRYSKKAIYAYITSKSN
jgi:predicted DNA-binding transcriptional regulator AlpA